MGKLQSKLGSKRRQSPEGGILASNVLTCQRELEHIHKTQLTKNLFVELKANKSDHNCSLKVVLPQKKTADGSSSIHLQLNKHIKTRTSHAGVTECNTQQEWVFTLYSLDNSGKITTEDMTSLKYYMNDVLEASLKSPQGGGSTPLKIKLTVTPSADPEKISQIASAGSGSHEAAVRGRYCVDENIERRNHYLDLAGIENYTSKFDDTDAPSQESSQDARSALKHHPVVNKDAPRGLFSPLKSRDRSGGEVKSCRLRDQHPASWFHPSQHQPAAPSVLQRSHSKRLRSRVHLRAQRHEHRHHHEHHHHHHHHHYHPS